MNIASKLVTSFDLAARPDFSPREGRKGQKRQRRGTATAAAHYTVDAMGGYVYNPVGSGVGRGRVLD